MKTKTVELSMKEFLIVVLRSWLPIFICAILLASLMGFQEFIKNKSMEDDIQTRYIRELSAYNETIRAKENELKNFTNKMNASIEHNKNSILLKSDPIYGPTASLSFSIKALTSQDEMSVNGSPIEGNENTNTVKIINESSAGINERIANVYQVLMGRANLPEILKSVLSQNYDQEYLQEIIRLEKTTDSLMKITAVGNVDINPSVIVQSLYEYIQLQQKFVSETATPHKLTSLGLISVDKMDIKFAEEQEMSRDTMAEYSEVIKKLQENIDLVKKEKPVKPVFANSVIKKTLMGLLIGLILASLIRVLYYGATIKIQSTEQIQQQLGARYLGGGLHKRGVFLGRFADKLSGTRALATNPDVLEYLSLNLREMMSGKNTKVLLTGALPQAVIEEFSKNIQSHFETERNISFLIGSDLLQNPSSLKKLEESGAVLFVERINFSKLKLVNQEIERVRQSGKDILGYILY